jgi:predicted component of type VI protein secretion system
MPTLIVQDGPLAGRTIDVTAAFVVGRASAGLTIEDPALSRNHARFDPVDGGLEVVDLGSSNGTWVNGLRVKAATQLRTGDVVTLGKTSIGVRLEREQGTQVLESPAIPGATQVVPMPPAVAGTPAFTAPSPSERDTTGREEGPPQPSVRPASAVPAAPAVSIPPPTPPPAGQAAALTPSAPAASTLQPLGAFQPPASPSRRGVPTRQLMPTILTFAVVIVAGIALILYFLLVRR